MNGSSLVPFGSHLLQCIKYGFIGDNNLEAKSMLSEDLVKAHDKFGTLLHYAARYGNEVIAEHLIGLGSQVDAIGKDGKTPLLVALDNEYEDIVKVLLESEANIDIADDSGDSALEVVLQNNLQFYFEDTFKLFVHKVRADASTAEESTDKLVSAGFTLYHAVYLRDFEMLEGLLARGFDVNSRGPYQMTALHAAAELEDLGLVKWLVDRGADVNSLDVDGNGPVYIAAGDGNKALLQFLLEQGANPNTIQLSEAITPLYVAVECSGNSDNQGTECVELLLQYGAEFQDEIEYPSTIFDCALDMKSFQAIDILIGHLAVLERLGTCIANSFVRCNEEKHREAFHRIKRDYELCRQTLDVVVFRTSTLFDLLQESDEQMKIHLRNETFLPKIEHFCREHKLSESCSYYYNKLIKSISRADYLIKLENTAIPIICKLLRGDYGQCFIAARKICDYLDEPDLLQLSRM